MSSGFSTGPSHIASFFGTNQAPSSSTLVYTDDSGVVTEYDAIAHELFGMERNEVEGRNVSRLVMPTDQSIIDNCISSARKLTAEAKGSKSVLIRRLRSEPLLVDVSVSPAPQTPGSNSTLCVRFTTPEPKRVTRSGLAASLEAYASTNPTLPLNSSPLGLPPRAPGQRRVPMNTDLSCSVPASGLADDDGAAGLASSYTFGGALPRHRRFHSESSSGSAASVPSDNRMPSPPHVNYFFPHRFYESAGARSVGSFVVMSPPAAIARGLDHSIPFSDSQVSVSTTPIRTVVTPSVMSSDDVDDQMSPRSNNSMTSAPSELDTREYFDDLLYGVRARLQQGSDYARQMRFNEDDCHPDIKLKYDMLCAIKAKAGMYRTVRAELAVPFNTLVYFEMQCIRQEGVCVGVGTRDLPLDKLVGSDSRSAGLSSFGDLVCQGNWNADYSPKYEANAVVAVLVRVDRASEADGITCSAAFAVNGQFIHNELQQLFTAPPGAQVFPTLSLYALSNKVVAHFAEQDMMHLSSIPAGLYPCDLSGAALVAPLRRRFSGAPAVVL